MCALDGVTLGAGGSGRAFYAPPGATQVLVANQDVGTCKSLHNITQQRTVLRITDARCTRTRTCTF